jgi:lipoate-protein ligase A
MKYIDLTFPTPAQNLACDEALLDLCEAGYDHPILRFWESPRPFVVLGYSNRAATEVYPHACRAHNIPILRRCSGGGAVVQGAGCLNYALVLRLPDHGPLLTITGANRHVLEHHRRALAAVLDNHIAAAGLSDLVRHDLKFSGNAQRRKRRCLLFHGTLLRDFDLPLVERLLPMPSRQPDYRRDRPHRDFLTNLGAARSLIQTALRNAWNAHDPLGSDLPLPAIEQLAHRRYCADAWNFKL